MEKQIPPSNIDNSKKLIHRGNNAEKRVLVAYNVWQPNREKTVKRLNTLADDLDEYHEKANIASFVGSGASAVSSAGLLLAPVTGGVSVILTIAGVIGSIVSVSSSLVESKTATSRCSDTSIQKLMDDDKEYTKELLAAHEAFKTACKDVIAFIHKTPFTDEQLVEMATILDKETTFGKVVMTIIKEYIPKTSPVYDQISKYSDLSATCIDYTVNIGKHLPSILSCVLMQMPCAQAANVGKQVSRAQAANVGKQMSRTKAANVGKQVCRARAANVGKQVSRAQAAKVGKQVSRAQAAKVGKQVSRASIGLKVVAGVSLALDIWTMASLGKDIAKGSKSETGATYREIAESLETQMDVMEKIMKQ